MNAPVVAIADDAGRQAGRMLPPATPERFSRVATYLADPDVGLLPSGTFTEADQEEYESDLSLDFVGQPSLGVGTDNFGNYVGGGASAYFSDMLGDKVLGVASPNAMWNVVDAESMSSRTQALSEPAA